MRHETAVWDASGCEYYNSVL